jgi:hypothetical protein
MVSLNPIWREHVNALETLEVILHHQKLELKFRLILTTCFGFRLENMPYLTNAWIVIAVISANLADFKASLHHGL